MNKGFGAYHWPSSRLLEGSWDFVPVCTRAYSPTYSWGNLPKSSKGMMKKG